MRSLILLAVIAGLCTAGFGQSAAKTTREEYIRTNKDLAIREMKRSGIPASITMAQACLESGDGNSRLARKANNHFGIKCHNDWKGKRMHHDDDRRNECFRKYASVYDSYRDHSDYLMSQSRYDFLFDLDPDDYKAWARGLKKAGYATDPSYAGALIRIIEENKLYELDREVVAEEVHYRKSKRLTSTPVEGRQVFERNRVKYVLGRKGDTFESLTAELGKLPWELHQYNDLPANAKIDSAQVVYIQPKRNSAAPGNHTHTVKEGETMYTISQLYAIKLEKLYEKNQLTWKSTLPAGTVLQLRKPVKTVTIKLKQPEGKDIPSVEGEEMYFEMEE
ncbi:MAG: glucosaminidase domain-containing protein [Bacteroidales bacterium]|nr:glucosaminidase domain-containing protein [Bacteroidales bacterium]